MFNYKIWLLVAWVIVSLLFVQNTYASHVSGGSIKYKALPNNRFYIEVAVFRDCSGIQYSASTARVTAQCMPSGTPTNHTLNLVPFVAPTPKFGGPYSAITFNQGATSFAVEEVSDVCDKVLNPTTAPNTACRNRGGAILGYTRFKYSKVITLAPCNYWKLGFVPQCCRNTRGSNLSSGGMYVETRFDSRNFPGNSAPDFADEVKPIPSACVGKEVKYGIGTIDHDGDSLRFEVNCAMSSAGVCAQYNGGFSATQPADSFKMDSATGLIRFVPKTSGKRVVAFWVKEYERCTGKWKAQTLRDVQFRVEVCNNNIPKDISGVSNVQNASKLGDYKIQVCNGEVMSFEDTIHDQDVTDTLVFNSNYAKVLPGATMKVTPLAKNKAVVKYTWRASVGKNPVKIFYLVYNDDRCNYPGNGFSVFEIEVKNSTNAGADISVCRGDTAYFSATGGKRYEWKSIWGDSLIWSGPNRNVWADTSKLDTNKNLKFLAKTTTYLQVWSDLNEGCVKATACKDRDTVKVRIAKDFSIVKHADTTICFNDSSIQIFGKADSAHSTYSYKWSPSPFMNNDSISNPVVTPIQSKYFYLTLTSDSGCIRNDSVLVNLTPPFPPNLKATTSDTVVCQGTKALLDIDLGYVPTSCGLSKHKCVGVAVDKQVGAGTQANSATGTSNAWPSPYANGQASAKTQYLYLASELQALGMTAGLINGISFNVKTISQATKYNAYTIKVKCTSANQLSSWELRTHQVFNPKTVTIKPGWNYHQFDTPYDYDGASNLIVEICYTNTSVTNNAEVYYTPTTFNSCLVAAGIISQCGSQSLFNASRVNRANTRFEYCKGPDPKAYTYKWIPSSYLNYDTLKNPVATVLDTITYFAQVQDTFGKCSGVSNTVFIDLSKIEIGKDTVLCPYDTVQVTVNPAVKCSGKKSYKWVASDTSAYISNDTIGNPFLMATKNTSFQLTFKDTCGCTIIDTFNINMRALPKPNISKVPPKCGLDNGSMQVTGIGGISPYKYSLVNTNTNSKDSNITGTFNKLNNGYFKIKVTDAGKCFILLNDTFTNTAPIIDSILTKDLTCYNNKTGTIDVRASQGIGPLSYSIDNGTTWVLTNLFSGLDAGSYQVLARSSDGCETKPITIVLNQPDSLQSPVYFTEVSCNGAADAEAISVPIGGTQPYTIAWGNGSSTDTVKGLSGGPDSLILTDNNGCRFVKTFNIIEYPKVVIDSVKFEKVTCNGYDDGTINVFARGGKQAVYYSINQGGTFSNFGNFNSLKPKGYGIRVRDVNNCTAYDSVTIIEPKEVEIFANLDSMVICVSTCTDLLVNATGGNGSKYSYHWTPGITGLGQAQRVCPRIDTKYWVYAEDTLGCISKRKEIEVQLYDSLNITPPETKTICRGEKVELPTSATGGDGTGYNYWWSPALGMDNPNVKAPVVSPDSTITYQVILGDNCGSPHDTDEVKVVVRQLPEIDFVSDTNFACTPGKIVFTNTSKTSAVNCEWKFGDGYTSDECNIDIPHVYRYYGKYSVQLKITDEFGCIDSLEKREFVEIGLSPIAKFTMDPSNPTILQPEVQFFDKSDGNIVAWDWNFAGYKTSKEQNPMFVFPDSEKDKYPIKLTVVDRNSCVGDTTIQAFVGPEFSFYVPSAFTPNGDGLNDIWKPIGNGVNPKIYEMVVFNRWGQVIFRSNNFEEGWDGKHKDNGELVPIGTYPYKIRVGDTFGESKEHIYRGTVTIYTNDGDQK